jgi:hypothetical protein
VCLLPPGYKRAIPLFFRTVGSNIGRIEWLLTQDCLALVSSSLVNKVLQLLNEQQLKGMLVGGFPNTHRIRWYVLVVVNCNQLPHFVDPGRLVMVLWWHGLESRSQ